MDADDAKGTAIEASAKVKQSDKWTWRRSAGNTVHQSERSVIFILKRACLANAALYTAAEWQRTGAAGFYFWTR
jgi:hypothetical protein